MSHYLEMKDDGPDETESQFGVTVNDFVSTNVHQAYLHIITISI